MHGRWQPTVPLAARVLIRQPAGKALPVPVRLALRRALARRAQPVIRSSTVPVLRKVVQALLLVLVDLSKAVARVHRPPVNRPRRMRRKVSRLS